MPRTPRPIFVLTEHGKTYNVGDSQNLANPEAATLAEILAELQADEWQGWRFYEGKERDIVCDMGDRRTAARCPETLRGSETRIEFSDSKLALNLGFSRS